MKYDDKLNLESQTYYLNLNAIHDESGVHLFSSKFAQSKTIGKSNASKFAFAIALIQD
jgi:hypothetical protein